MVKVFLVKGNEKEVVKKAFQKFTPSQGTDRIAVIDQYTHKQRRIAAYPFGNSLEGEFDILYLKEALAVAEADNVFNVKINGGDLGIDEKRKSILNDNSSLGFLGLLVNLLAGFLKRLSCRHPLKFSSL